VVYNDEKNKDIFVGLRHEWELYQQDSNKEDADDE
jgi:hypothetical protein